MADNGLQFQQKNMDLHVWLIFQCTHNWQLNRMTGPAVKIIKKGLIKQEDAYKLQFSRTAFHYKDKKITQKMKL